MYPPVFVRYYAATQSFSDSVTLLLIPSCILLREAFMCKASSVFFILKPIYVLVTAGLVGNTLRGDTLQWINANSGHIITGVSKRGSGISSTRFV